MLKFDVKRKINTLRDILVGKVPDPKAQVEQITIAMIYKFMDDMDIEAMEFGGERVFFKEEYEKYAWSNLMSSENSGQQRALVYAEGIDKMSMNPHIPQLFRDIFRGAYVPYRDPETLNMFLKEIGEFSYDNSEDLGNAFEYLLMIMGSQGDAGMFRTPRHIIDMMVEIVNPKKNDTILDPACGTAGFLISAYKHILKTNVDENGKSTLSPDDKKRLSDNFAGYDISPSMVMLARVNMYLHRFAKPQITEYDTLSSDEKWDDTYDVILANPPFMTPKGGIIPHNKYRVQAKRAEVLFVDYIAEHLNPTGKAAIIVPEGIVFQSATAYKELRKYLVGDGLLYAVISLPAGVFNPYSGVKTSVLLIDKTLAKQRNDILFIKMNHDGFDLGAQRREIKQNDIPDIINILKAYQNGDDVSNNSLVTIASKETVTEQDYILVGERYRDVEMPRTKWDTCDLGSVVDILDNERKPITKSERTEGEYPYYGATGVLDFVDGYLFDEQLILVGEDGAKWGANEKSAFIIKGKTWVNNHAHVLRPNRDKILDAYLVCLLNLMDLSSYITGVTVPKLNQKNLKSIVIPLPPLSVQKEIVEEIESYQKIVGGAKQIVDNYKPSIKINPEWEMITLNDVCGFVRGPFGGSLKKEIFVDDGYLVYEQYHAINNNFDFGRYFITDEKFKEMKRFEVLTNDLLISCSGTMGKIAIVPEEHKEGIINQALLKLTPSSSAVPMFLKLYLESSIIQNKYFTNQSGAAIQNVVSVKELKEIPFPNISIVEQEEIANKVKEEIAIIEQNKQLIEMFEQKISDKISEVWGE